MTASVLENLRMLSAIQQLLAHLYRFPLTREQVEHLKVIDVERDGDEDETEGALHQGISLIRSFCVDTETSDSLSRASDDFHYLFVGPDRLPAPPWSSVYMDTGSIFSNTELAVEREFKRFGLANPEGHREPSDHIAYELQFIVELQNRAVAALERGDSEEGADYLRAALKFTKDYVMPWVGSFCDAVQRNARVDFYRGLALLTVSTMDHGVRLLNSALGTADSSSRTADSEA